MKIKFVILAMFASFLLPIATAYSRVDPVGMTALLVASSAESAAQTQGQGGKKAQDASGPSGGSAECIAVVAGAEDDENPVITECAEGTPAATGAKGTASSLRDEFEQGPLRFQGADDSLRFEGPKGDVSPA